MDSTETANTELEARLRAHYENIYGEPEMGAEVWAAIAGRLSAQEGGESVEFARSVDSLYRPGDRNWELTQPEAARPNDMQSVPRRPFVRRPVWGPALAAGLVLALVGMLVVVMTLTRQVGERIVPGVTSDDGSGDVLVQVPVHNPGFEEGFDGWVNDKYPYQN